ncbi:MAG TPA: Clp protease N-terminal domain-containing protein [Candidatus Limnocylindrales bacterium]|nr:Clp protease N-terminal domain-containing protein [Candidatus Limnocylindrales bacterium]
MFERFTEKARRVIFFARYEASQYGSPYIETEHLLLGLLREDPRLASHVLPSDVFLQSIRDDVEASIEVRERISTSVEVPLTAECKRILNFAFEEANRLEHKHIDTCHLLLGILKEENCFAASLLAKHGVNLKDLRPRVASTKPSEYSQRVRQPGEVPIGATLELFTKAWGVGDEKKLAALFGDRGQLWDVRGKQWTTPAQIEKGLAAHFESMPPTGPAPEVTNVKFITGDVSFATLMWEPPPKGESRPRAVRIFLVFRDTRSRWVIESAELAMLEPG